jgi:hypothetical protein
MTFRIAVLLPLMALVSACSTPPRTSLEDPRAGQVGFAEVDSAVPSETRLMLAENESFQPPLPEADNAAPEYPADLLAQRLTPQAVCVRLSIDEHGAVADTAPVDQGPDCTVGMDMESAFYAAAVEAVMRWRFEPAFRCVFSTDMFPEGSAPNMGCGFAGTQELPQAVSLTYRFVFEQVDGQGQVRIE